MVQCQDLCLYLATTAGGGVATIMGGGGTVMCTRKSVSFFGGGIIGGLLVGWQSHPLTTSSVVTSLASVSIGGILDFGILVLGDLLEGDFLEFFLVLYFNTQGIDCVINSSAVLDPLDVSDSAGKRSEYVLAEIETEFIIDFFLYLFFQPAFARKRVVNLGEFSVQLFDIPTCGHVVRCVSPPAH